MKVYGTTGALLCTGNHACVNIGGEIDEVSYILCSGNACDTYPEPTLQRCLRDAPRARPPTEFISM
jgi:hypothetical protein